MKLKLAILLTMLSALTANAWTQEGLMRRAYGVRGQGGSIIGNALDFTGTASGTRMDEAASDTNYLTGATSLTICAWVKSRDSRPTQYYLNSYSITGRQIVLGVGNPATRTFFAVNDGTTDIYAQTPTGSTPTNGTWCFQAGTWTIGQKPIAYINGNATTGTVACTNALVQNARMKMGYTSLTATYWAGTLDEVAIWTRNLAASELSELYNAGAGLKITSDKTFSSTGISMTNGLVRLYHLDESGTATNALDSVSGAYKMIGTRVGSTNWVTGKVPQ